jgi:DNA-binding transcriptional ArsR family regulator
MNDVLATTKALADETRLRVLMLLEPGELCLCQLIAVLGLSPSTVSKHVSLLSAAGLVRCRKEGRWHYYGLAGRDAPAHVRDALKWVKTHLRDTPGVAKDREACCAIADVPLEDVSCCYR